MRTLLLADQHAVQDSPDGLTGSLRHVLRIAGFVLLGFFGIFLLWGLIAPLSKAAVAPGVVQVEGRRRVVQHLEGGIVREILVRENQRVRKGQPLMRLDGVQTGAAAQAARSGYLALLAEEKRLEAELNGAAAIDFPDELNRETDTRARELMENQRTLLASRRQALAGQQQVLRVTSSQAQAEIGGLQAQVASQESQLVLLRGELATVQQLVNEQLERRSRLLELQRAVATAEGQVGNLRAQILRAQRMMSEANARIGSLTSTQREENVQKLRDVRVQLGETREKMRSTSDINQRRTITAPVGGQVVELRYTTIGGVVGPGQPVMDIVPDRQQFIITARVRPIDIENVIVGLPTEVRLLPYSGRREPMLMGRVTAVSDDAMTPENGDPPYYLIEVQIDDAKALARMDVKLLSGMPAEVYVVLGKRSLFSYLFQPLTDSFRRSFREN